MGCASSSASRSNRSPPAASPVAVSATIEGRERVGVRTGRASGVQSDSAGSRLAKWGARWASSRMTRLSVPAMAASIGRVDLVAP